MNKQIFNKVKKVDFPKEKVEVKIFQNKNNKQFNLPVLKKNTSPQIIKDIFNNKDIIGFKFEITDLIFKNNLKGVSQNDYVPFKVKGVGGALTGKARVGQRPSILLNNNLKGRFKI